MDSAVMVPDILEKLRKFLTKHVPLEEECHLIYLLVEIRKILDHAGDRKDHAKFPLLRFYADWSVHTAKDRPTPEMKQIMECLHKELLADPGPHSPVPGLYLAKFLLSLPLKNEMQMFLQGHDLPGSIVAKASDWWKFAELLSGILSDQPLTKPCTGIRQFSFKNKPKVRVQIHYETKSGKGATREFGGLP